MKALKTDLAKSLLADPRAAAQLRSFVRSQSQARTATSVASPSIEITHQGQRLHVVPKVVAKAA